MKMLFVQLMFACLSFHPVISSGSGRHSLWLLATYISGTTSFPEFSAVLMLDDIQVGYFDSDINRLTRVGGGRKGAAAEVELDVGQEAVFVLRDIFSSMRKRLALVKHRFNLTAASVHVQQRLTGCEVLDGQPALIMFRDSSDGHDADSLMYNMTHFTYAGGDGWEIQWGAMKRMHVQMLYSNIYLPLCVQTLKNLLDREKRLVMRRVRPQVHFMTKRVVGGAWLTCLATDFYPRHINMTLLRDGRAVEESELSGSVVLPNGNGLYQVRKKLMVDDEELRRKHNYTCTASHLSLDNRLEVIWRAEFSRSHRNHFFTIPAGLMLAFALLTLLLLLLRRWRHRKRSEGVVMETRARPGQTELN